jgi:hypothetical protein
MEAVLLVLVLACIAPYLDAIFGVLLLMLLWTLVPLLAVAGVGAFALYVMGVI